MKLACENIKTIEDITNQIKYDDKVGGGAGDGSQVSCGQDGKYNELKNKYIKYLSQLKEPFVGTIMCKCCKKLKPTGREKVTWSEYYTCLKSYLTKEKHPQTIAKLDKLIK